MPAGRPLIPIDWKVFDKLCGLQCTVDEFAAYFDCSVDTIQRAVEREKEMNFAAYYAQKKGSGKVSIRRKQMEVALAGNPAMLIWLGKNMLDQKDRQSIEQETKMDVSVTAHSDLVELGLKALEEKSAKPNVDSE